MLFSPFRTYWFNLSKSPLANAHYNAVASLLRQQGNEHLLPSFIFSNLKLCHVIQSQTRESAHICLIPTTAININDPWLFPDEKRRSKIICKDARRRMPDNYGFPGYRVNRISFDSAPYASLGIISRKAMNEVEFLPFDLNFQKLWKAVDESQDFSAFFAAPVIQKLPPCAATTIAEPQPPSAIPLRRDSGQ